MHLQKPCSTFVFFLLCLFKLLAKYSILAIHLCFFTFSRNYSEYGTLTFPRVHNYVGSIASSKHRHECTIFISTLCYMTRHVVVFMTLVNLFRLPIDLILHYSLTIKTYMNITLHLFSVGQICDKEQT